MERFNYFYIIDLTTDNLKHQNPDAFELLRKNNPYTSFLAEVELSFYKDSFYFYNIETMLIRTMDTEVIVRSNLNQIKDKSGRRQNITNIDFEIHDGCLGDFEHPDDENIRISDIELYTHFAKKHFANTGIDFLAGYDPPKKIEIVKSNVTHKTITRKIQIINHKTIRIQYEDRVRNIPYSYDYIKRVDLVKSLTESVKHSIHIYIREKTNYPITIEYGYDDEAAEADFKTLENLISPPLPF